MRAIVLGVAAACVFFNTARSQGVAPSDASVECSKQADEQGLHGVERKEFRTQCKANGGQSAQTAPKQVQKQFAASSSDTPLSYVANTEPPDAYLSLRTEPASLRGKRITTMPNGTLLEVLKRQSDGWWQVRVVPTGQVGWTLSGDRVKRWIECCKTGSGADTSVASAETQQPVNRPSFNCATAKSASARLICSDAELSNADGALGKAFQGAIGILEGKEKASKVQEQVKWIRERNTRCQLDGKNDMPVEELRSSKQCLLEAINARVNEYVGAPAPAIVADRPTTSKSDAVGTQQGNVSIQMVPQYTQFAAACPGCSNGIQTGRTFAALDFTSADISGMVVCVEPTSQRADAMGIGLKMNEQNARLFLDDEYIKNLLGSIRKRAFEECSNALRAGALLDGISNPAKNVSEYTAVTGMAPAGNQPAFQAFSPSLHDSWTITYNLVQKNEQARIAQIKAQADEQQRQRDAVERQRQQDIAQARIDAQSGDPLIGNWKGQNITLRITKNGSLYLVHVYLPGSMAEGDYAGPLQNDQILIANPLGPVSVLNGKTELLYATQRFTKVTY